MSVLLLRWLLAYELIAILDGGNRQGRFGRLIANMQTCYMLDQADKDAMTPYFLPLGGLGGEIDLTRLQTNCSGQRVKVISFIALALLWACLCRLLLAFYGMALLLQDTYTIPHDWSTHFLGWKTSLCHMRQVS